MSYGFEPPALMDVDFGKHWQHGMDMFEVYAVKLLIIMLRRVHRQLNLCPRVRRGISSKCTTAWTIQVPGERMQRDRPIAICRRAIFDSLSCLGVSAAIIARQPSRSR